MWIALAVLSIVLAVGVVAWRLTVIGRRMPTEIDGDRQHEVPDAAAPAPGRIEGGVKRTEQPGPDGL